MQSWCTSNDSFAFISRVYNGMAQDELLTLSTCVLIDEFEAGLKSMEDYKAALNHTFHSALPLHDFCKLFVIPLPGGWPTWYYTKKIIAQLPEPSSQEHPYFSLIPEEGPFHLCLNINEDVIKSYHIKFLQDFIRRFWAVTSH